MAFTDQITLSDGSANHVYDLFRGREVLSPTKIRHIRMVSEVDDTPELLTIGHDLVGLVQRTNVRLSKGTVNATTGKRYELFAQFTMGFTRGEHTEAVIVGISTELKNFLAASGYPALLAKMGT